KQLPMNKVTIALMLFLLWMTFTSMFALEPNLVWIEWARVMKSLLMVLVAMLVIRSEQEIKALVWVIALSLGFYGFKGGLFTLLSGGTGKVLGPAETSIADNNDLALALIVTLPMIWFLLLHAEKKWLRVGLAGLAFFTLVSVIGSYSRGAF